MKQLLLSLVTDFITAGLRTLMQLHRAKHGEAKNDRLKNAVLSIVTELEPIAEETKTHVDDTILQILSTAVTPK